MVEITVICKISEVSNVIAVLESEGWVKDSNMHGLTLLGKVKFCMLRKFGVLTENKSCDDSHADRERD